MSKKKQESQSRGAAAGGGPGSVDVDEAMKQLVAAQRVLDYDTKEFTIELLVQKFGDGEGADIYVPSYQRRFNWDRRRQSRFIESVLLGLPIPFLFFGEEEEARYEIVDGMQRLSTCSAFQNNLLELVGLERLDLLDGFRFRDLSTVQQRKFKNRTIRSVVLSDKASDSDRRDLFDRINTGSLIAEPAEIRRGVIGGPVTDLIDELAGDASFQAVCPITPAAQKSREREELIARLFAFGDGLDSYQDKIREFLNDWLKVANERAKSAAETTAEYRDIFTSVVRFVEQHFPIGFRKTATARTTPRVRFDAIAVGIRLALEENPNVGEKGPFLKPENWLEEEDFQILTTSGGANVKSKIENRIHYVKHMLLGQEELAGRRAGRQS